MNPINKRLKDIEDLYPMSDIQKGMVYHSLRSADGSEYLNQTVFHRKLVNFQPERFQKALALMVETHPILRTGFNLHDFEEPIQIVYKNVPRPIENYIEYYDVSHLPKDEQEEYINNLLRQDKQRLFDFTDTEPLWRMKIFAVGSEDLYFVWICHHAIIDGWSCASLMTALNNTYMKLSACPQPVPEKLKNSYKAFVIEQIAEKKKTANRIFWKNELKNLKRLEFFRRENTERYVNMKRYSANLGRLLLNKLKAAARKYNISPKHICFAAYVYVMGMVSYENDILVGLVVDNRPSCQDGEKILGCFLNTIPVRITIPDGIRWLDYMSLVDKKMLELKKYERVPLAEIVKITGESSLHATPLFDTIFNFMDFHIYKRIIGDEDPGNKKNSSNGYLNIQGSGNAITLLDFNINMSEDAVVLSISYPGTRVAGEAVENIRNYFENFLNKSIDEPRRIVRKHELIPLIEKQKLLHDFNNTGVDYPRDKTIHELFAEQVERTPDNIALHGCMIEWMHGQDVSITYKELNESSNQLAGLLIEKGVKADTIVGILEERSVEMIIGILAILESGGAYLPIDPGYPEERKKHMLTDSEAEILVTTRSLAEEVEQARRWEGKKNLESPSSSLVYVIYTSGSMGKPKGVGVYHRSFLNLVYWYVKEFNLNSKNSVLLMTSLSFDLTQKNIFAPLITGGILHLPEEDYYDPHAVSQAVWKKKISWLNCTPGMFYPLVAEEENFRQLTSLRYVFLGGEPISFPLIKRCFQTADFKAEIVNTYGPTECTDVCSYYPIEHSEGFEEGLASIPIGKPISNVQLYVLDGYFFPQPLLLSGELFIGGDGLGSGYLNDISMTSEKFVTVSLGMDGVCQLYRTGDLARWLPEGDLEFIGRIDHQVKIRGFRVELGEIENCLLSCDRVKEAAVVVKETQTGDKHLCAYLVPDILEKGDAGAGENELSAVLKEYLLSRLPAYMIPQYFVLLEMLPLTVNGKLDRKSLPDPGISSTGEYTAPRDEREEKLADIWSGVLGVNKEIIGIDNNFFDLGGHSLSAIILAGRINKELNAAITLDELFQTPTLRGISSLIEVTRWVKEQGMGTNLQQQGKEILL